MEEDKENVKRKRVYSTFKETYECTEKNENDNRQANDNNTFLMLAHTRLSSKFTLKLVHVMCT